MVNCSHCGKEIKRNVFCNASCKVMFHRNEPRKEPRDKEVKEIKKQIKRLAKKDKLIWEPSGKVWVTKDHPGFCKHGAAIGNCKFGCKK